MKLINSFIPIKFVEKNKMYYSFKNINCIHDVKTISAEQTVVNFIKTLANKDLNLCKNFILEEYINYFNYVELSEYFCKNKKFVLLNKFNLLQEKQLSTVSFLFIEQTKKSIIHFFIYKETEKSFKIYDIEKE